MDDADPGSTILKLVLLFLLIMVNALFAMSEIAIISLNDTKLQKQAESGNKKAAQILKLISNSSGFLSTIQIGVTLAGFLTSALAAQSFAVTLANAIGRTPIADVIPMAVINGVSTVLITLIMGYFNLVLGELVPKKIAMQKPEQVSFKVVSILMVVHTVAKPFVKLLSLSTNAVVRLLGMDPNAAEETVTEEEIRMMVDAGQEKGVIEHAQKEMINNIFEFDDIDVSDVMTHRTDMACVAADDHINDVIQLSISEGYSRIPVYGDDLDTLTKITQDICDLAATIPGYENISNGQEEPDQVIRLVLDKDAAMRKGLTVAQIFSELNGKLTESTDAATVTIDGEDMKIVVKDGRKPLTRENLLDYNFEIQTTDDNGNTVTEDHPLSEFATLKLEEGVQSINRENQSRYMTVTATVAEGSNATLLSRELQPLIDAYELPDGYTIDTAGESDMVNQMVIQMSKVLLLGLALIYLVMVAQFQSLLSPFIVLFTVPLAFTGGLIGLLLMNEPLSVMGMMGFVVLLGTVVNNGIVFVDYANQLRVGGLERREALIATGKTRMRPILMTALTTILAMASLLFGESLSRWISAVRIWMTYRMMRRIT